MTKEITKEHLADLEEQLTRDDVFFENPLRMADDCYHAIKNAVNASKLASMKISASKMRHSEKFRQEKDCFDQGTLIHAAILEPEVFAERYVVKPKFDRRTKKGKEAAAAWDEENPGKLGISPEDMDMTERILGQVKMDPFFSQFFKGGVAEGTWLVYDQEFKIWRKVRLDYWIPEKRIIVDLKTTGKLAHPNSFNKSIRDYDYLPKASYYMDTIEMATGKRPDAFVLIAVEKGGDHDMSATYFNEYQLACGTKAYRKWLGEYVTCLANDVWPRYERKFNEYQMTQWEEHYYEQF